MKPFPDLDERLTALFGAPDDPMDALDRRARQLFPQEPVIVWQCDPRTFGFSYVGGAAEAVLGYPGSRWLELRTFWADCIVHPDDRDDTMAYCALATRKGCDHEFEYRAVAADGRTVWLRDVVRVVRNRRLAIVSLRGAMFDVTGEKASLGLLAQPPRDFVPTLAQLAAGA